MGASAAAAPMTSSPSVPPWTDEGESGVWWSGEPSGDSRSVGDIDSSTMRSRDFTINPPLPAVVEAAAGVWCPAVVEAAGFEEGGEFALRIGESQG